MPGARALRARTASWGPTREPLPRQSHPPRSHGVIMAMQLDPPVERVVIEVDTKLAPLAAENFIALCLGFKGTGTCSAL